MTGDIVQDRTDVRNEDKARKRTDRTDDRIKHSARQRKRQRW